MWRIFLVGVNVGLLAAFGFLWSRPVSFPHDDKVDRKSVPVSLIPPFPEPLEGSFDRVLFRAKTLSDADDKMDNDGVSEPVIRLLGVVLTDEQKIAMVEHAGALRRVEEGVDLEGWRVTRIEARAILLANTELQIEIPLDAPAEP